jgi:IclR family transcriptional regulator, pca regulon regulatory protein
MMADDGVEGHRPGDHVRAFERGLSVIRAFHGDELALTLSEVAQAADLPRAATRRFLLTLVNLGYVDLRDRRFSLTPKVLELGYAYLSSSGLPALAQPHLEQLSAQTGESCSVSVLDGEHVVYVARVATSRIMRVAIAIGTRFPAWATSMGRVLLADLPADEARTRMCAADREAYTDRTVTDVEELTEFVGQVREQGYALVDGELEEGLRSLAVPIRDVHGKVVAAMNLSTQPTRVPLDRVLHDFLPALRHAADLLEADLITVQRANNQRP